MTADRLPRWHTRNGKPVHERTADHRKGRFNKRVGLLITSVVGTMPAAYLFALMALLSLPAILTQAFHLHAFPSWLINASLIDLVAWVSSYFLQLFLLPVIIVGQNAQAEAADVRAAKTFEDSEQIADWLNLETEGGLTLVLSAVNRTDEHFTNVLDTLRKLLVAQPAPPSEQASPDATT